MGRKIARVRGVRRASALRRALLAFAAVLAGLAGVLAAAGVITRQDALALLENHGGEKGLRYMGVGEEQIRRVLDIANDTPKAEPIAWWRAEGDAQDAAGLYHGTVSGAGFTPGLFGSAFSFTEEGAAVTVPMMMRESGPFTLSAWVRYGGVAWPQFSPIIVFGDSSPSLGVNADGLLEVSDAIVSSRPVPIGQWTHVAYVFDGSRSTLYVQGLESGSAAVEPSRNGGLMLLGRHPDGAGWTGRIDEVRVYNRALSDEEMREEAAFDPLGSIAVCPAITAIWQTGLPASPLAASGCEDALFWQGPGEFELALAAPQTFDQVLVSLRPKERTLVTLEVSASTDGVVWTRLGRVSRTVGPSGAEMAPPKSPPVRFGHLRLTVQSDGGTPVEIRRVQLAVPRGMLSGG